MKAEKYILPGILLIAAFFRLYSLDSIPPGMHPDEAINATLARRAMETGDMKVFYKEGSGKEGLFINLATLGFRFFGVDPVVIRALAAFFGILTVLGLYLLTRQLYDWRFAAIAGFLMATLFWHVNFSRIAFRAILAPFCFVFAFYFLFKALTDNGRRYFVLSGIFTGIGMHTYIAFRIVPVLLAITFVSYWILQKRHIVVLGRKRILIGMLMLVLTAGLITLPLVSFFLFEPEAFLYRMKSLSVFRYPDIPGTILRNTSATLLMFNFHGDDHWHHNIRGSPMLLLPLGILFWIGILQNGRNLFRASEYRIRVISIFLLSWFVLGLVPAVLTKRGLPHALRTITLTPLICIFAAQGLFLIADAVGSIRVGISSFRQKLSTALIMVLLISLGFWEYDRYFRQWAQHHRVARTFRKNSVELAKQFKSFPASEPKYVVLDEELKEDGKLPWRSQPFAFLTDSADAEKQKSRNIMYVGKSQYRENKQKYDHQYKIHLDPP